MPIPDTLLGGRRAAQFLREYWQKKPLLIRGAFPDFTAPISPEELAGISLEEDAESRLILEEGGDYPWQLRYGPFREEDFAELPESKWTLLVQEVDRWVPEVAALLEAFRFVPQWRIDDVMVSYAPDGGNVGAHVDNYDVFLLQALGRREWRIGMAPVIEEHIVPDVDVSMLADFEPDETWTLEAGDLLYLPPRIAHHGIAEGDCMTFSIGFRAPSHEEMLTAFLTRALEETDPKARYSDPDLDVPENPALIDARALERVRRIVRQALSDEKIDRWFGALLTESVRADILFPSEEDWSPEQLATAVREGAELQVEAPLRTAFLEREDGGAVLFMHGDDFILEPSLAYAAPLLSSGGRLTAKTLMGHLSDTGFQRLLARLVNEGHLVVHDVR